MDDALKKKNRKWWPWGLLLGVFLLGVYWASQFQYPVTKPLPALLAKYTDGASERMSLRMDEAWIDFQGRAVLTNVRIGAPPVAHMNRVRVRISFWNLLMGRYTLRELKVDSLVVFRGNTTPFLALLREERERMLPELWKRLEAFSVRADAIMSLDSSGAVQAQGGEAFLSLRLKEPLSVKLDVERLTAPGWPEFQEVKARVARKDSVTQVKSFSLQSEDARLSGRGSYSDGGAFNGYLSFKKFNIFPLTTFFLKEGELVEGRANGSVLVSGIWRDWDTFNADGDLILHDVHAKNVPVQRDLVIQNYMTELADLQLREVRFPNLKFRERMLYLDTLEGKGSPLSFTGKGEVAFPMELLEGDFEVDTFLRRGKVSLFLLCHLDEDYYKTLKPLVREGLYRDDEDRPSFRCQIKGDLRTQHITLEKVVSRVIKSISRKVGNSLKKIFR